MTTEPAPRVIGSLGRRTAEESLGGSICGMKMFFFFQAEDGIRDGRVTGVKTCALPISAARSRTAAWRFARRSPRFDPSPRNAVAIGVKIGRARVGKECRSRWSPYH